ncbi:hypothetical protein PVK06_018176 [Gossypium arboreum]|uniref:Retrovirus-related Pol polyprotein from transposon TNT 1-94 n=1 Tax=Gossypium arboreum TaxID=29729 RepID=A0ABR0Q579_GOSAR|nr:hypothetical protein PVK06_018176 [Gossypium arboreum]
MAIPPEFVSDESGRLVKNPKRVSFNKQDKAIASLLLSVVNLEILPDLVISQSTAEIWEVIGQLYSTKTTTKIINLQYFLYSQKKGDKNICDYLRQLKLIKDNLGICGEKISDAEHITAILNGLPSNFDSVVTLITTSKLAYDVPALSSMLIDFEARQKLGAMAGLLSVNLVTSQSTSHGTQSYQQPTEGVSDLVGYRGRRGAFVAANGSSTSMNATIIGEYVWFPDSGDTSYLTRDASSVINSVLYADAGKVTIANGLSVDSVGSSSTTLASSSAFISNDLASSSVAPSHGHIDSRPTSSALDVTSGSSG